MTRYAKWWDSLLLFVLTAILIWPLFRLKYLDNWPSIESTFISDARLLREHLPHPGWQPLWYCGTRFDYIYPPALRYGTALISEVFAMTTARAYHLYTAVFYCFGIVGIYWLVLAGSGARLFAYLAAIATALLSPSFLLLHDMRVDSGFLVPQRLHVLMSYGEGPHISAISVMGAALAATFLALPKRRPLALIAAGVFCALTVGNNFYGATSLAILFPIVAWCVWLGVRETAVWWRAAGIIALAYGLSAFWLTPSFIKITVINLRWVSHPGNNWSRITAVILIGAFCAGTYMVGNRRPERTWTLFVSGAGFLMGAYVLGFFFLGFRTVGEPGRLVPELDLVIILAGVEILRGLWRLRRIRIVVMLLGLAALYPSIEYLQHAYTPFPRATAIENRIEYQMTKWASDHLPGERVLPSGTIRFWFNTWFNSAQPDGGSAQGMLNQILPYAFWEITHGDRGDLTVLWLQALGTSAVIVPGKSSPEYYHDYLKPEKFHNAAQVLFDDGHNTIIYGVPRRYPGIGRVVDSTKLPSGGTIPGPDSEKTLRQYVDVVENQEQSETPVAWHGFDEMEVHAKVAPGRSVLLQETYDPAWRAYEGGKRIPIRAEPVLGFMLLDVSEGAHDIRMRFETPLENRIGQILLVLTLGIVVVMIIRRKSGYNPPNANSRKLSL